MTCPSRSSEGDSDRTGSALWGPLRDLHLEKEGRLCRRSEWHTWVVCDKSRRAPREMGISDRTPRKTEAVPRNRTPECGMTNQVWSSWTSRLLGRIRKGGPGLRRDQRGFTLIEL